MSKHLDNLSICTNSDDRRKIIVLKENQSEYRAINNAGKHVITVRVDGCLITTGERCDYFMDVVDDREVYLIELKGSDLDKAIKQLMVTYEILKKEIDATFHGRVVLSKTHAPDLRSSIFKKLQMQLSRKMGTLKTHNRIFEETIS